MAASPTGRLGLFIADVRATANIFFRRCAPCRWR